MSEEMSVQRCPDLETATDPDVTLDDYLSRWVVDSAGRHDVALVVATIVAATIELADLLANGCDSRPDGTDSTTTSRNSDHPTRLDRTAHQLFVAALRVAPVRSVCCPATRDPLLLDANASLAVAIDPIDGASKVSTNAPVGTIFAVVPASPDPEEPAATFLRRGSAQLAAGFVMYGAATILVLTVGNGTATFVLDRVQGRHLLIRDNVRIPEGTHEFAIDASNYRHWDQELRAFVDDLIAGASGPRGADFTMWWMAALVADAYRILIGGGIFLYPGDDRPGCSDGHVRLIYGANPIAMLIEQANGTATDGEQRILDKLPRDLHEQTPVVFGSTDKVAQVARYRAQPAFSGERSPLFSRRGVFRSG
ncbi:MAG: class 1 fructose-bisphosphatase [Ilumatobacteraceae bacterium]